MQKYTRSQQNVIDYRGEKMLVSASAGTGKTTVMIERLAKLIAEGVDVSELVVVTFTNLAAAEMKNRLATKLAEYSSDLRIVEQLEKLNNASICTIHSFCNELLRNYFYVVDIDPSFAILDSVSVASLRSAALDEVFKEYFKSDDEQFKKLYKIFATKRKEENFKKTLLDLYEFARCLEDFEGWYQQSKQKFVNYSDDNPIITTIYNEIKGKAQYFASEMRKLQDECAQLSPVFAANCNVNAEMLANVDCTNLQSLLFSFCKVNLISMGTDKNVAKSDSDHLRTRFDALRTEVGTQIKKYSELCRGKTVQELWQESAQSVQLTDKLVEVLQKFDHAFFQEKKQRGGLDFGDLEHLTLKLLKDEETAKAIHDRCKMVFVDEYQDTNPVQEAIISRLAQGASLFMVGDIKQSIYGFRGCEPTIFLQKYLNYKQTAPEQVEELNENFRSNNEILQFVNDIFNVVMTQSFGKVDYQNNAQLQGDVRFWLSRPNVHIDLLPKSSKTKNEIEDMYDITAPAKVTDEISQGEFIAQKIADYVGMAYKFKNKKGEIESARIGYGDIVILIRSMKDKATEIYNSLIEHNIPVAANFKTESYTNKEVRDLINFMRVVDNPYNDIYVAGSCLSPLGGLSENELAQIKIESSNLAIPFYTRMQKYVENHDDATAQKALAFLQLVEELRFYARSATVDEVVLKILEKTNYHLYVQGYPNGGLRLRKLYAFVDGLKGASFAQSVDKFLSYLDDMDETLADEGVSDSNAVRIMTMHASKGLEFPIVIVAATEHNFKFDYPTVERNNDFGLAMKYYDFETMSSFDTLGSRACGMYNKVKTQEEEMRLLYVALTRAKMVLNIVGYVSEDQLGTIKPATSATCHLDWILNGVMQKYGSLQSEQCSRLVSIVREKTKFESATGNNLLCEQYTDETAVLQQIDYQYPFQSQTKMPSKIVSSALDREFIDADRDTFQMAIVEDNDRNAIGTAYHKVLQYVNYNATEDEVQQTIDGLVNEGKIPAEIAAKLNKTLVVNTLNNAGLRQIMQKGRVYHEIPFMLYTPYNKVAKDQRFTDEVMLQGVIDLLVVGQDHAWVVDFKYSTHVAEQLRKDYVKQLESYRLAVQQICGITNVNCYIMSIVNGVLVEM